MPASYHTSKNDKRTLLIDIIVCILNKKQNKVFNMWIVILVVMAISFVSTVTWLSYYLGKTKTENPVVSGVIGFFTSLVPPVGLIYLVILSLKQEVDTV